MEKTESLKYLLIILRMIMWPFLEMDHFLSVAYYVMQLVKFSKQHAISVFY